MRMGWLYLIAQEQGRALHRVFPELCLNTFTQPHGNGFGLRLQVLSGAGLEQVAALKEFHPVLRVADKEQTCSVSQSLRQAGETGAQEKLKMINGADSTGKMLVNASAYKAARILFC